MFGNEKEWEMVGELLLLKYIANNKKREGYKEGRQDVLEEMQTKETSCEPEAMQKNNYSANAGARWDDHRIYTKRPWYESAILYLIVLGIGLIYFIILNAIFS